MWPFKRKALPQLGTHENRSSGAGYTHQIIAARESYIAGSSGLAELTATVQGCVTLWESAMALADVQGTDLLTRRDMALAGRSLALRGEAVFLITDLGLVPAVDWDLSTRNSRPTAYRLTLPEAGGGRTQTALAAEVLHFRIGCDIAQPYIGTAPLRRCSLTAALLHTVETALAEAFENMPLGSQVVPMPEMPEADLAKMARGFRGNRGRVLIRESVNVSAAGGPAPQQDWKPSDVTPDLSRAMTRETLTAARDAICGALGVLPGLFNPTAQGNAIREYQRHLATWQLQPVAMLMGEECTDKLGMAVMIDTLRPLQAFDAGGRARALSAIVATMAAAKEAGLSGEELNAALTLVNWGSDDKAA